MTTEMPNDSYEAFEAMADEDIVAEAQQNNNELAQDYLLHKYKNFVRAKARSYFLIGAEREDIISNDFISRMVFIIIFTQRNIILASLNF